MFRVFLCVLFCFVTQAALSENRNQDYQIGVYYFPGWKDNAHGAPAPMPWQRIKDFPEREPLLGWYKEGEVSLIEQQLQWMHDYGIKYVVYDWYWDGKKSYIEHGLDAYSKAKNKNLVKFSLLWANHEGVPKSDNEFSSMVSYWLEHYFLDENYLRIDGKPVVFVFWADNLKKESKKFGSTTKELFDLGNKLAKAKGLPGIYFVAGSAAGAPMANKYIPQNGYSALSAYNYHSGTNGKFSHSYEELDLGYREHWNWILQNAPLPYIIPMTSGWDKRPWGGSTERRHDDSVSTPETFEQHLRAAKKLMDQYPAKSMKMGVICCWNEFGEGSYIEPTKKYQFKYLEAVKNVFDGK